jgi:tRNA-dependent cyclodipeptide synthase
MRIKTYLNTNKKEIENKKFNIWIGISFGNKYFTKNNIKEYILWALEHTREDVAVLIADKIHAINYELRNHYTKQRALQVALRKGQEIKESISKIIRELPKEQQKRIDILLWKDIENNEEYKLAKKNILQEFKTNPLFHKKIVEISKENLAFKFNDEEFEKLSSYVLNELPIFIKGVRYEMKVFDLIPYPGLGKIDELAIDLLKGKTFPELTKKLKINLKIAILEAYVK